jgi:phosphoglycolate phosphatase
MADTPWWDPYEAVVFDLDGTLLRLDVDWQAVEAEIGQVLESAGLDPNEFTAWELLDAAETVGLQEEVDDIIATHEVAGARDCERLPMADAVAEIDRPVGVVSLNDVEAVRLALESESLLDGIEVVIGRGSVPERKPSPEPLLEALNVLGVEPEAAVFVGDSAGDETTARRAGVDFRPIEA